MSGSEPRKTNPRLDQLASSLTDEFESTHRVLTFDEWFDLLEADPRVHARSAAQYVKDTFDHYGRRDVRTPSGPKSRFCLFDANFEGWHRLVGQEEAQNEFYEAVNGFVRVGRIDKLLLLNGPNGSAKSTLLETLQRALEAYSRTEPGALYCFSWVFPSRDAGSAGIGFGGGRGGAAVQSSYARLAPEDIEARIGDEIHDHPILLLPAALRKKVLERVAPEDFVVSDAILFGELSHRNRRIFDALLASNQGDLRRVLQHVRIERFFLSRQYRQGLVTVEPKQTVDARSFPVTGDRAFSQLPPAVGGQVLYGLQGDLVDANRGLINFSDLFKRPYEHFKYLLTATESGQVTLDHVVLGLNCVFTGSANDLNVVEFRSMRPSEYQAFRARLELVRVPFLVDYRVERKIYQEQVGDLLRGIHIAPHVPTVLALWGVMTRLRRPNPDNFSPKIADVIKRITPLEKADLYAYGRVPRGLTSEEARELLAAVPELYEERFAHVAVRAEGSDHLLGDYEGSFGASVRDLKGVLLAAATEAGTTCVTMPRVFDQLREFLADSANHRWMALEPEGSGFHLLDGDPRSITMACWDRWLDRSDWEVREAMGLVDEARYLELFRKYVVHVSHFLKRERLFDSVTGEQADPDEKFMTRIEKTMEPNRGPDFRADVLSRIGAWALSHPDEEPAYDQIFPDYFARLREDYYEKQKETVGRAIQRMLELLVDEKGREREAQTSTAEDDKVRQAIDVLLGLHDGANRRERHTRETLKETLVCLAKERY